MPFKRDWRFRPVLLYGVDAVDACKSQQTATLVLELRILPHGKEDQHSKVTCFWEDSINVFKRLWLAQLKTKPAGDGFGC